MIIILSPSKGQDFTDSPLIEKYSHPRFLDDSEMLIGELRKKSLSSLKALMSISDTIAELNTERYRQFSTPFTADNAKQAIFAFKGDVYSRFKLSKFSEDDFSYAQCHLRILSGLYGCLRPLDLIQPYRLEMKIKLTNPRGGNLYQFWGTKITDSLNNDLKKQQQPVLINLASNEYFKAVRPKLLEGKLLNINFKETKNGKTRVVAIFAKRARGMMADFIIRQHLEDPQQIKQFNEGGYRFNELLSDDEQWTFERSQIQTAGNQ